MLLKSHLPLILSLSLVINVAAAADYGLDSASVWKNVLQVMEGQAGSDTSSWFTVDLSKFSIATQKKVVELRSKFDEKIQKQRESGSIAIEYHLDQCQIFRTYAQSLLDRIISANNLKQPVSDNPLPLRFGVDCSVSPIWIVSDASMSIGTINVHASALRSMHTEDELAAVIAHELSHYLLRHDAALIELRSTQPARPTGSQDIFATREQTAAEQTFRISAEQEADALGVLLALRAGFNGGSAVNALEQADALWTEYEENNTRAGVNNNRRALTAERIRLLKQNLGSTTSGRDIEYPAEVQSALDFYFDPKNFK